mmetsp:Transcript_22798/g.34506  ORF Transcript_22798/g.34506 Transcript_22798/m.34506 type:complete len:238 (+) Transcript_22798:2070-2783(+)
MLVLSRSQFRSQHRTQHLKGFSQFQSRGEGFDQIGSNNQTSRLGMIDDTIFQGWIDGDRHVGRHGPWRCCPNGHLQWFVTGILFQRRTRFRDLKSHVNAFRYVSLGIFQFRFRQRRATAGTPMDGFPSPKNKSFLKHFSKDIDLGRFEGWLERQVGIVEITKDTVPLKGCALFPDGFFRKRTGLFAQRDRCQLGTFRFGFDVLQHLQLDGQTVAIPSGNVGDFLPLVQQFISIDKIL